MLLDILNLTHSATGAGQHWAARVLLRPGARRDAKLQHGPAASFGCAGKLPVRCPSLGSLSADTAPGAEPWQGMAATGYEPWQIGPLLFAVSW